MSTADTLLFSVLTAIMGVAALLQIITIRCIPIRSIKASKAIMAAGFLILAARYLDMLLSGIEFSTVRFAIFAIGLVGVGSIVSNLERIVESKERRKQRDFG